jgi:copper homeostasis protein
MILEICCTSVEDCLVATTAGAHRVELCIDLSVGGLTPEESLIRDSMACGLPVMVLIRPHARGFVYTDDQQQLMLQQCSMALNAGASGLVIGALTPENEIDGDFMGTIRKTFPDTPLTFHRAIDETVNIEWSFNYLIELGFERVLCSGGTDHVTTGIPTLTRLKEKYGQDIAILAGGGLRSTNVLAVMASGVVEIHTSARTISTGHAFSDVEEIKKILTLISQPRNE